AIVGFAVIERVADVLVIRVRAHGLGPGVGHAEHKAACDTPVEPQLKGIVVGAGAVRGEETSRAETRLTDGDTDSHVARVRPVQIDGESVIAQNGGGRDGAGRILILWQPRGAEARLVEGLARQPVTGLRTDVSHIEQHAAGQLPLYGEVEVVDGGQLALGRESRGSEREKGAG